MRENKNGKGIGCPDLTFLFRPLPLKLDRVTKREEGPKRMGIMGT